MLKKSLFKYSKLIIFIYSILSKKNLFIYYLLDNQLLYYYQKKKKINILTSTTAELINIIKMVGSNDFKSTKC